MEWSLKLKAPFYRASELKVELEFDGKTYLLDVVNCFGPTYILQLGYELIPPIDRFQFTLKISRVNYYLV